MRVVELLPVVELEFSLIDCIADLAVSFPEGNALVHELIDGLHAKEIPVFLLFQDIVPYLNTIEHQSRYPQTSQAFPDGGEKDFLGKLQVPMIA